jgi:DNA-binding PadR family transcriptional regulator
MTKQALQEPTFLILTALAGGAQHGYGIMTDVARISQDRVKLRAGTLYAALDRLLGDGIVGVDREEIAAGRLRSYYRLTPAGADLLAAEAARLSANATVAAARLRNLRIGGAQADGAILAGGAA